MSRAESRRPLPADGFGPARLQPATSGTYDWAESDDERRGAENLDRLLGDRQLIDTIRADNFEGLAYDYAATELAKYAIAVLTAWIVNGTIYAKCAEKARPVQRSRGGPPSHRQAESLAGEVVAVALTRFVEKTLVPDNWDPSRGASLATYFVGQCILSFPNVYRQSRPDHEPRGVPVGEEFALLDSRTQDDLVEDDVIRSLTASAAFQMIRSEDAREAFALMSLGYTQVAIAARMGKTVKAVERMIDYARSQVTKERRKA